jgi:hypothetical protein
MWDTKYLSAFLVAHYSGNGYLIPSLHSGIRSVLYNANKMEIIIWKTVLLTMDVNFELFCKEYEIWVLETQVPCNIRRKPPVNVQKRRDVLKGLSSIIPRI